MTEESKKIIEETKISVDDMTTAGMHFGHRVSRLHPKMKPYISGIKNNVNIFDLEKTAKDLQKALNFISRSVVDGKSILLVGTKIQIKNLVKQTAQDCGLTFVVERWLGGTFTNYETINKRVQYFKDLEKKKAYGEFEKYTKKERMGLDKEIESLRVKFEGIKEMTKLPDVVVIFDIYKDDTCLREAKRKGIKIVAICDTNTDPSQVDYPIPANDDAISSVKYVLEKIKETILNSK
jgi:small subunit ribosomal protein S2